MLNNQNVKYKNLRKKKTKKDNKQLAGKTRADAEKRLCQTSLKPLCLLTLTFLQGAGCSVRLL